MSEKPFPTKHAAVDITMTKDEMDAAKTGEAIVNKLKDRAERLNRGEDPVLQGIQAGKYQAGEEFEIKPVDVKNIDHVWVTRPDLPTGLMVCTICRQRSDSLPENLAICGAVEEYASMLYETGETDKAQVESGHRVYRRKPLLVSAKKIHTSGLIKELGIMASAGDWLVEEAGILTKVDAAAFPELYEESREDNPIGVGKVEYPVGTRIDQDGKRLVRVKVVSGQGHIAYWAQQAPMGSVVNHQVIADVVDNITAAHRAGRFLTQFEGKPGEEAWVVL